MSAEFLGQEHANFFRQLTNAVNSAISREKYFWETANNPNGERKLKELEEELAPALKGSALVTFIANVEHLVDKKVDGSWDIPAGWYGKEEFKILRIIRHCWAHAAGRVLTTRRSELEEYLRKLQNGEFVNREGQVVKTFFSIENDKVILRGLERARVLYCELLAEKGLIEKWY